MWYSWLLLLKLWLILDHYSVIFLKINNCKTGKLVELCKYKKPTNIWYIGDRLIKLKSVKPYIVVPQKNGFRRRKYISPFLPRSEVLIFCFHFAEDIQATENLFVWSFIYKYGFVNWIPSYACGLRWKWPSQPIMSGNFNH